MRLEVPQPKKWFQKRESEFYIVFVRSETSEKATGPIFKDFLQHVQAP